MLILSAMVLMLQKNTNVLYMQHLDAKTCLQKHLQLLSQRGPLFLTAEDCDQCGSDLKPGKLMGDFSSEFSGLLDQVLRENPLTVAL